MSALLQDVRYAGRFLLRSPGFAVAAVLALALGIGPNTAIFSVVKKVLLEPLPYPDPDRLVRVWESRPQQGLDISPVIPANFLDWRDRNTVFESVGWSRDYMPNMTGRGEPESIIGYRLSANFFDVLGIRPALGRTFLPEEDTPGKDRVVILSHRLWQRRFGADPRIIGQSVTLDGAPYEIIGVMPPKFAHPADSQLWTPIAVPSPLMARRDVRFLRLVARLKPGRTRQDAQSELTAIYERLERQYPDANAGTGARVVPLRDMNTGDVRPALLVLLGAVGFVLLIACANIANLLIARAIARHREIAVRVALGATRSRMVRQFLTEGILLALAGAAAGLVIAWWSVHALLALFPTTISNLDIPRVDEIPIDLGVLAFTLLVAIGTGTLVGLLPAWQASRQDLNDSLKEGIRGGAAAGGRTRSTLIVVEAALALMLLVGAALMVRSFVALQSGGLGFDPENVLTVRMMLPRYKYTEPDSIRRFVRETLDRVQALPGVQAAGYTNFLPLSGWWGSTDFAIEGKPDPKPGEFPAADYRIATPDYFRAMGIRLLRGRHFDDRDVSGASDVVIVNETLVRRYFGDEDPLGRRLIVRGPNDSRVRLEIVGVVGDVKSFGLEEEIHADLFRPFDQEPFPLLGLTVRTHRNPAAAASAVRDAVWRVDRDQPVSYVLTMEQLASESRALRRGSMIVVAAFAILALVMAAVGIYGVMAYLVAERTREIGIRMALGAERRAVLRLVVGQALKLVTIGAAIGIGGALLLTRLMRSVLYGVSATDPLTFLLAALILPVVALLASGVPAYRAMRVDPVEALRHE